MQSYFWKTDGKENADPCLALRAALDKHSEFRMYDANHLEFDDFSHLRCIVLRQAIREFEATRKEIDAQRIKAFQNKDQNLYQTIFRSSNKKFHELQQGMVKEACDHLKMREEVFGASQKHYMEEESTKAKLSAVEKMTRVEFFATVYPPCSLPLEKVLEVAKFSIRSAADLAKRTKVMRT